MLAQDRDRPRDDDAPRERAADDRFAALAEAVRVCACVQAATVASVWTVFAHPHRGVLVIDWLRPCLHRTATAPAMTTTRPLPVTPVPPSDSPRSPTRCVPVCRGLCCVRRALERWLAVRVAHGRDVHSPMHGVLQDRNRDDDDAPPARDAGAAARFAALADPVRVLACRTWPVPSLLPPRLADDGG